MIAHSATKSARPTRGASTRGSQSGARVRTYSGFSGAELARFIAGCSCVDSPAGPISTRGGASVCTVAGRALMNGSSGDLDLERARVLLRVLAVPHHAVDQAGGAHRRLRQARLRGRSGVLVEIDAVDLLRHREIVHVLLEQAPAAMLGHEPHAVGQEREGDVTVVVELHVVRVVPGLADAVVVAAEHAREDYVLVGVNVGLVGDDLGRLLTVRK